MTEQPTLADNSLTAILSPFCQPHEYQTSMMVDHNFMYGSRTAVRNDYDEDYGLRVAT